LCGHLPTVPSASITTTTLGLLILAFHRGQLYPVELLGVGLHLPVQRFLASGCLMISKTLRIPALAEEGVANLLRTRPGARGALPGLGTPA
jgi:hypothetical protein